MSAPDRDVRARTRPGRLARLDAWLVAQERPLLEATRDVLLLDVGFGESLVTTEELALAVRPVNPSAQVIGLERDAERVRRARSAHCEARVGGFDAVAGFAPAAVVRAMNVLRGYRLEELGDIMRALAAGLGDGGVLLEGSTDTEGHVGVAQVLRRTGGLVRREALLFFTDFSSGFAPAVFRDCLPREFRRDVRPGTAMHAFFMQWSVAWASARGGAPEADFAASVHGFGPELRALSPGVARWSCAESLAFEVRLP